MITGFYLRIEIKRVFEHIRSKVTASHYLCFFARCRQRRLAVGAFLFIYRVCDVFVGPFGLVRYFEVCTVWAVVGLVTTGGVHLSWTGTDVRRCHGCGRRGVL